MKLTFLLAAVLLVPAAAATHDLSYGTIQAPDDFVFKHTGTTDSFMGTLTRKSDGFTIYLDIGKMAGTHMHEGKKAECSYFRKYTIGAFPATTGILKVEDGHAFGPCACTDTAKRTLRFEISANFLHIILPEVPCV